MYILIFISQYNENIKLSANSSIFINIIAKNTPNMKIGLPEIINNQIEYFKKEREIDKITENALKDMEKKVEKVLFIDVSNEFEKAKNQNNLTDGNVEKIVATYKNRETIDKYSYVATLDEIKENDYNLNIPRYVDTFEEEEQISLDEVATAIQQIGRASCRERG